MYQMEKTSEKIILQSIKQKMSKCEVGGLREDLRSHFYRYQRI